MSERSFFHGPNGPSSKRLIGIMSLVMAIVLSLWKPEEFNLIALWLGVATAALGISAITKS